MTKVFSKYLLGTAFAIVLPVSAVADVSAIEVWDNWKSYAETFGQTVTAGSEKTSGDTLTLNDVTISMEFPDGSMSGTMESLELRERGDGTVAITMSPDLPFTITADPDGAEAVDIAVIVRQSGTSIIASGGDGTIVYDYLAAEMAFAIDKFIVDGKDIDANVDVSMTDVDGKYTNTEGEMNTFTSQMAAGEMTFDVAFTDPEKGGKVTMNGSMADLRSNSAASVPVGLNMEDPAEIFSGGVDIQGGFTAGAASYAMSFQDGTDDFSASATSAGSVLDFALLDGSVKYGGSTKDVQYSMSSSQLPFPEVTFGMAETAFDVEMPLAQSEEPSDYGFLIKIVGLEFSEMIWAMFDGGGTLPRDPATLIFDVGGQLNWLIDLMDPEAIENFSGDTPAQLHDLTINDITLSAVGADVKGTGHFTFDNTDLTTFNGMPAPTGAVDLNISGINGLIDNLIAMGLLPQEQAMGARMMIGLFARPAGGEDELMSKIEVNGDGSVFANGQQLK